MILENGVTFAQRTKANFLSNLWTWTNLYGVDTMDSLLDFLWTWTNLYGVDTMDSLLDFLIWLGSR